MPRNSIDNLFCIFFLFNIVENLTTDISDDSAQSDQDEQQERWYM